MWNAEERVGKANRSTLHRLQLGGLVSVFMQEWSTIILYIIEQYGRAAKYFCFNGGLDLLGLAT